MFSNSFLTFLKYSFNVDMDIPFNCQYRVLKFVFYFLQKIKELDQKIFADAKFNQMRALKTAKDLLKLYDQVLLMGP